MGATEVLRVLRKNEPLTAEEIARLSNQGSQAVRRIIGDLLKDKSEHIAYRTLSLKEKKEKFDKKLNCRIFVYWIKKG
jgi:hypothetical protein